MLLWMYKAIRYYSYNLRDFWNIQVLSPLILWVLVCANITKLLLLCAGHV
jgi:hypothetical protein